ncbi:MAG TPA: glycine cleavage system protein GcvH [Bacteroidota bacterium]|nr:glycine cleavage system protein GcvH [Bacteroidota bacterium]
MNFPETLKYTKDHEWLLVNGDTGTVGITDHAQGELGDVVFVELPAVGKALKQHESFGTIEAVKAVSDLFSPVSGTVVEINTGLQANPELVNKDPYGKGWMLKIKIADPKEITALLSVADYKALVGK